MNGKSGRISRPSGALQPVFEVPSFRQALPQISAELRRARRFEHPLAVVVIGARDLPGARVAADGGAAVAPAPLSPADSTSRFLLLGSYLRNTIRETDLLTAAPESLAYAVFLIETSRQGAELAIARYRAGFEGCAAAELRVGCAEFPHDGLMAEDLLERASRAWDQDVSRPAEVVRRSRAFAWLGR